MADEDTSAIAQWLETAGLAHLVDTFIENGIDEDVLTDLTVEDLRELGLRLGDRKRLLKAIEAIRVTDIDTSSETTASPEPARPTTVPKVTASLTPPTTRTPPHAELRQVTIVFLDLVASTDLSTRLDPEDLGKLMARYRDVVFDTVNAWNGHVAEFLGDGAVIYFGWPVAHEDDAERAVRAAIACNQVVGQLRVREGENLSSRAGIATGRVMVGEIGHTGGPNLTGVIGDTPNIAARVQGFARPGQVVITPQTHRLAGQRFELEHLGSQTVKGVGAPLDVWAVKGVRAGSRAAPQTQQVAMVGRDRELKALVDLWDRSIEGKASIARLSGEAGIGKTKLVSALLEAIQPEVIISIECAAFHSNSPLQPVIEWVQARILSQPDAVDVTLSGARSLLNAHGLYDDSDLVRLGVLLSLPIPNDLHQLPESPALQRTRTLELLCAVLVPESAPSFLVLEDIHWADATTLELLDFLSTRLRNTKRSMLIVTERPGSQTWEQDHAVNITLKRLNTISSKQLVAATSGEIELPEKVRQAVIRFADGVPLYIEELALELIGSGVTDNQDLESAQFAVPDSLQDLFLARLDGLGDAKRLAQLASVLGRAFPEALFQVVAQSLGYELQPISRLFEQSVLRREQQGTTGVTYSFRHALTREAAYDSLLKATRRELHAEVGRVTLERFAELAEREPAMLAHHFEQSEQHLAAASHRLSAGSRALNSGATVESIAHFRRGLEMLDSAQKVPDRYTLELRLQAMLGSVLMQVHGWGAPEVEAAYAAATSLTSAAESVAEEVWILWGSWVIQEVRGNISAGEEIAERICWIAETSGDAEANLIAHMLSTQILLYGGKFRDSRQHGQAFLHAYERYTDPSLLERYSNDLGTVTYAHLSFGAWITGDQRLANQWFAQAIQVASELNHPFSTSWMNTWGSAIDMFEGRVQEVLAKTDLAAEIALEQRYEYIAAMAAMMRGWALAQTDPAAGAQELDVAITRFKATGAGIVIPFFTAHLGHAYARSAQAELADASFRRALRQTEKGGEHWSEAEIYRLQALAILALDDASTDSAERSFLAGFEVAAKQGARRWQSNIAQDLVQFYQSHGQAGEAEKYIPYTSLIGFANEEAHNGN